MSQPHRQLSAATLKCSVVAQEAASFSCAPESTFLHTGRYEGSASATRRKWTGSSASLAAWQPGRDGRLHARPPAPSAHSNIPQYDHQRGWSRRRRPRRCRRRRIRPPRDAAPYARIHDGRAARARAHAPSTASRSSDAAARCAAPNRGRRGPGRTAGGSRRFDAAAADGPLAAPAMMPSSQQKIEVLAADHAGRRRPVGHARQAARREVPPPRAASGSPSPIGAGSGAATGCGDVDRRRPATGSRTLTALVCPV